MKSSSRQVVKLSSCQAVKLSSCQAVKLSSRQVVKSSSRQVVKLSSRQVVNVLNCGSFPYKCLLCVERDVAGKFRRYFDGDLVGDLDLCSCQVVISSSCQVVQSSSCQAVKLSSRQVVKSSSRQVVKSSSRQVIDVFNCGSFSYTCRLCTIACHVLFDFCIACISNVLQLHFLFLYHATSHEGHESNKGSSWLQHQPQPRRRGKP